MKLVKPLWFNNPAPLAQAVACVIYLCNEIDELLSSYTPEGGAKGNIDLSP